MATEIEKNAFKTGANGGSIDTRNMPADIAKRVQVQIDAGKKSTNRT